MVYLSGTQIELLQPDIERGHIKHALFDFDGTVSLIREGWQGVMIPTMVEFLLQTPRHEGEEELKSIVTEFVGKLTGKQTIYQMIQLSEEINKRGGNPADPLIYKRIYHDRLIRRIGKRISDLKDGKLSPTEMMVPGSLAMVQALRARDITCYLASGTDIPFVHEEATLLGISNYFAGIYGAVDDYKTYSKQMVIEHIITKHQLKGSEFVAFGDGYVEIEETKTVGGIAVGVATNEATRQGTNEWKRHRLISAGADIIVPDFREYFHLVHFLCSED